MLGRRSGGLASERSSGILTDADENHTNHSQTMTKSPAGEAAGCASSISHQPDRTRGQPLSHSGGQGEVGVRILQTFDKLEDVVYRSDEERSSDALRGDEESRFGVQSKASLSAPRAPVLRRARPFSRTLGCVFRAGGGGDAEMPSFPFPRGQPIRCPPPGRLDTRAKAPAAERAARGRGRCSPRDAG